MGESYYDDADDRRWKRQEAELRKREELAKRGYVPSGHTGIWNHVPCGAAVFAPDTHDSVCPAAK